MLNYQRIFVPAIFIACVVFSGQVFADDAVSIKPKLIAVGSSEEVWALDASDNMLLYRRNPNTFRYEEVNSNIEVDALDVSLDGVVVALSGKKLYLWNEESQSFQQHGTAQQLDQVAIGDGAVWGLDGQTAYYWDSDNFDFAKAPGAFTTLTVAKEDDAVFAIGTDRKLYLWDGVQEQLESFNISLSGDIQLSARSKNNLWALVGNSRLYQWNSASSTFVDQTEKFALGIYLNQFALDSQKIIYGVSNNRLVFYDIESFAIEMDGTKEADGPVSTLDKNGKQHIIYNQGGSIYHSYAPSGAGSLSGWIEAKPISQSTGGTHLNVAVDNTGNVHASWISGVENSKEIYYAYGKPNSQVGGYNWSDTIRVSNDNVADDDLTMVLGPQGRPIFLTTKIDAIAPHADRDIYHHTLDMNENPPTFDGVVSLIPLQNEADHLEIDPLYNFLRAGDNVNLESSSNFAFSLTPLGAMSWTWDWKGKMIKFTVTGVYGRHTDRAGNVGMEPGIGGTLVIKLGEWTKTVFGYEISIEAFIEGAVEARYLWAYKHGVSQLLLKGDVDLLFEIPVYGNKADPAIDIITAPLQAAGIMPVWEISVIAGVRLQLFDFLWDPSSEEGGEEPENFCMAPYDSELGVEGSSLSLPPFLKITDKGGNPPAENTPNEDTRMHFDTESFASYMYSKFLSTSSGVGETESQFISHLGPGIGMKFEEKWGKGTAKFDFTAKMMFWLLFDLSGNKDLIFRQQFLIKQDAGPLTVTWLNLMFTEHLKGAVAPTAEYSPGGTATVHGERPLLGDGTGTNTVDEGALSSIIVGPKAYGVFTQETGDSTFQAVYVITGDVDQNTGDINWKPNTVFMIPQSGGFNTDPLLAAHYNAGSQQDDQLIVTWGSVPADSNPLVDSLANTPPGRTYVVYGQDAGNAVVDVSEFSTASGSDPGFYLTNQLALYGIGSSVGHLGDVDGNGVDDFIFGAPDAEVEQGRTYIVFGELFKPEITKVATASWLAEDAQDASSTYEVLLKFQGVDADGDNILRGRGSNLSAVDSGYVDELTEWTMEVYHKQRRNNELLATFGWDDKQAQGDFNFNFDLVKKQVFASDPDSLGLYGLNIGPGSNSVGRFNLQTSEYKEIQLIDNNNNSLTAAYTELGNDKFTTSSTTDTTSGGIQPDIDALKGLQGLVLAGGTDDELGFASGSAGDFNNDGRPDLMVSAPGANDHLGAVYILYGGSSLNSTTGIVDAAKNNLPGIVLIGKESDERLGTSISAGVDSTGKALDVTGDGKGDIIVGASNVNAVYIYTDANDPSSRLELIYGGPNSGSNPALPLGADVALIPSIDGDPYADILVGTQGMVSVIYGGPDFLGHTRDYTSSWKQSVKDKDGSTHTWQVVLSFGGKDTDKDGILRGRGSNPSQIEGNKPNEINAWMMRVYRDDVQVANYAMNNQNHRSDFNFNFDLDKQRVLASDDIHDENGLNVGFLATKEHNYNMQSDTTCITLTGWVDGAAEVVAASQAGDQMFDCISNPGSFDLATLDDVPGMGMILNSYIAQPMSVAGAGDINNDGYADIVIGYGETSDPDTGDPISGGSFLLYGSASDTVGGTIQLEDIENYNQGIIFKQAGGTVQAAGDFNGDGIDDLVIGAPAGVGTNTRAYVLCGKKNGNPTVGLQLSSIDTLALTGAAVAPAGDLNGDGKTDLLIGAPYMADPKVVSNLQTEMQIQYAALPLVPGSGEAKDFNLTQSAGIGPMLIGSTGSGSLLTWVEVGMDSTFTLYGSFWKGTAWGTRMEIRNSPNDISHVSISDIYNTKSGSASVPTVVWQETDNDRGNQPSLWQGVYNITSGWSKSPFQPVQSKSAPGQTTNDESSLVVDGSEYNVEDVTATEADGYAIFEVIRSGNTSYAHTLHYRTVDISASAGLDYGHSEGKLNFAKGETSKTIKIPIHQDNDKEHRGERVLLVLKSRHPRSYYLRNGLRRSGTPRMTAELLISDDDDKVLELTAINSGFIVAGDTAVSFGGAVSSAGDINKDGYADFLVGASGVSDHKGVVYLVYGKKGIELKDMDLYLSEASADDSVVVLSAITDSIIAGSSVASGSGYIAIGAPGNASTPGKVYVVTADMLKGKTSLVLESDAIVLHTTANTPGNRFGATLTFGNVDNTGGDDLVIVAPGPNGSENPGQVYVVYDSFLQTTQAGSSYIIDGTKSNIDVITNSAGTGFGLAAAVGDFDYDNNNDLILGSTHGETLYDQLGGGVRGYGGQVFAIWGKSGQHGSIDIGNADSIVTFSGQAEFSQSKSSPSIDPGTGAPQDNPAPNFALTDGIGDVVVLLDLDGNGCQDLAIGAPSAFIARPDGSYDVANILSGRIYVLFGSSDWKRKNTYDLINLYGDDYKMGIVLEGKLAKSLTGASLANAGFVRGTADSIAGIEDLLIGAPSTNADAGQAYLVFGSANRYTKNVTQAGENILKLDSYTDPANTKVALLFAYQGITNPLSSDNSRNSGKVGQSVAGAGDINGDGADDILIGAPTSSVKGLGQTYIPIGHPWIMPGQHLNVKDLRSDNGFVLQVPGPPAPVGDVNGDGYDDVVMLGESPELVLGATPMANVNGVRQFQLLPRSVISDNTIVQAKATWTYHISTSGGHTWTVYASFTGVDRDNDGILRGRVDQSQIDGGYYNELTDWTFEYWESYAYFQNNALKCCKTDLRVSYDWLQQQANTGFNFNYDIAANKVINSGKGISDANGCYLGLRTDYYIKAGSDKYFRFYHSGNSQEIGGNASFPGTPIPNTPVVYSNDGYQLTWNGEGDYKVVIDFGGMDLDGDGILRGRGTDPASVAQGSGDNIFGNELTSFLMRVYHGSALSFTYQLEEQQQRSDFNFNYDLIRHEVVAEDEWNTGQGINLGIWNIVGAYDFSSWVSDADIKLQLINDAQGKDREDVASTGFGSQYFHLTRQPTVPGAQEKIRYAGWKPASGWTVDLYFTGSDRNGDGYIRGRGKSNTVGGLANELTQFTMIVAQNGVTKATYYLSDLLNLNGSNFNFWVLDKAVRASGQEGDVNHGIKIGVPSGDGYVINSNTGDLSNANIILKQIKGGKYTVVGSTGRGDNRFTISSSPLGVVGPLVAGDFNGDSYEDFILFTNLGTLRTAALETNGAESRPAYIYYGNTDATFTVSRPDTLAVPLSYISGAKTGDLNGDGYQDLVISGYNYNISDAATAPDKSYLLAYYGGSDPFDLSIPDTILYTETGNISRHVLAVLDINNNGQDDIVTYTLKRVHAEIPPLPYLVTGNVVTNKIENLYILGADSVGGTPSWQEPITLSGSTFADGSLKTDMLLGLVPGRQADVNNDGKIDLIFTAQNVDPSTYGVGLKSDGYVLLSSGSFTFQDGSGKLNTVEISYKNLNKYSGTNVSVVLPNPEAAPYQSRITGIGDFNLDGIDDIFVMPDLRDNVRIQPYSYVIHGNDKFGYNEKSSYTSYSLEDADKDFSMGTAIEGLQGILEPYTASDAGDLNGDGFGDIMMADVTNALSYGIYGYRADSLSNVEYITGSDDDDVLQQFSSTKTTVNISGKGGDDFIQTLRTVKGLTTPYSLVLNGGPGDDQIGISTTIPKDIIRIDGGPGFDQLFINPYYAGNRTRLDLTDMAKHIRNIELIDLAANNSIEFGFVEVRNLSETSNTLLLRGTNSAAIVQDGNNWKYLGQSTHDGVVYNVHEYLPVGNSESDIQVWVEYSDDPINNPKVNWNPVD